MAELLLELFSEEIPARMQRMAAEQLREKMIFRLKEEGLFHQKVKTFVTPRRLVLSADGLSLTQEEKTIERRGPRVGAPDQALEGFLRSTGLSKEQLTTQKTDKGDFYFAVITEKGKPTKDVLKAALEDIISDMNWPKSMRWGATETRWVRPLQNIACIFGGEILPIEFGHLVANDNSQGHRFLGNSSFTVDKLESFKADLKKRKVMLSLDERKESILDQARELAASKQLELIEDDGLLEEVAGLVEWPVALMGNIEAEFMTLPEEALISSIKVHQKYLCLRDKNGDLAPHFIVISNMETADNGTQIIAGNERVLRARLSDAVFFWQQDLKSTLEEHAQKLDRVIFHAKLGTVDDKTNRVRALAKYLSMWVPHANLEQVDRAALLSKSDLATEMVGEFPDLQGIMGYYYAIENNEDQAVADAISAHYRPAGLNDSAPTDPVSVAVAIADKMDTLSGLFAADEKPTGSKDPYALRRAALGIIRIIMENKLNIPLKLLIDGALKNYPKSLFIDGDDDDEKKGLLKKIKKRKTSPNEVSAEILEFFIERLKVRLKEENVRHDLITAVFGIGEDDLLLLCSRAEALDSFLKTTDGESLLAAYKRTANILEKEEKKEGQSFKPSVSDNLLEINAEKRLNTTIKKARPMIKEALKQSDFSTSMELLAKVRPVVDSFFDEVVVNDENPDIRKNRLRLLASLRELFDEIADFSAIEG